MQKYFYLIIVSIFTLTATAQDVRLPQKPKTTNYTDHSLMNTGFWCSVELETGSSVMFNKKNLQVCGVSYIGGFRFNEFLRAGVGFGGRYYFNNNECRNTDNKWTFPIFINIRGNIISQEARTAVPYWSMSIGSAVRDGFFVSPTIGYRFGELRDSWLIGLSYSYNVMNLPKERGTGYNSLLLRVGYEF